MNSKDYWTTREREALEHYLIEEKEYSWELNRIYDSTLSQIEKEIESFYQKYADDEGITIAEAMKRVSKLDIKQYEAKAQRYIKEHDLSEQANAEMKLYNLTMKINRLEMLKSRIGLALVEGYDQVEKELEKELNKRAMDEFTRQAGILGESVQYPEKKAKALVNASYKWAKGEYGFSDALWTHQTVLKSELAKLLQQGLIQGKSSSALASGLVKAFDVSRYAAERLMRTELSRVQTGAQMESFKANGYDKYMYITLSSAPYTKSKVCEICKPLNGQVFDVEGAEVGNPDHPLPPMHPNCRCSISAYMDPDEFAKWLQSYGAGLGTGTNNVIKPHDKPIYVTRIDPDDPVKVQQMVTEFEDKARYEKIEMARVITADGDVYDCFGTKDSVYPDSDLGDIIRGGIITHSHPISETAFSFGSSDLQLFFDYELQMLRGCDEKYTYEYNRKDLRVDESPEEWQNYENFAHADNIRHATIFEIGYRRWINE